MTSNRLAAYKFEPLHADALLTAPRPLRLGRVARSLRFACQGLRDAWVSEPNLRIHAYLGAGFIAIGSAVGLSLAEWLWVSFAIGLVIFAELMNTAIEHTVDLVVGLRPDPLARRIKDVSAGCVLVATLLAILIESLTFLPRLLGAFAR